MIWLVAVRRAFETDDAENARNPRKEVLCRGFSKRGPDGI